MSRRHKRQQDTTRRTWRTWWETVSGRWQNSMPKFFKVVFWICSLVSGTALAVNTAVVAGGGTTHEWWVDVYPYLIGIPAGMAFVCKFTQTYGRDGKPIEYDEHRRHEREGRTILDEDKP